MAPGQRGTYRGGYRYCKQRNCGGLGEQLIRHVNGATYSASQLTECGTALRICLRTFGELELKLHCGQWAAQFMRRIASQ